MIRRETEKQRKEKGDQPVLSAPDKRRAFGPAYKFANTLVAAVQSAK